MHKTKSQLGYARFGNNKGFRHSLGENLIWDVNGWGRDERSGGGRALFLFYTSWPQTSHRDFPRIYARIAY